MSGLSFKVTVCLWGFLASKRCSASGVAQLKTLGKKKQKQPLLYIVSKTVKKKKEIEQWPTLDFWRKSGINLLKSQKVALFIMTAPVTQQYANLLVFLKQAIYSPGNRQSHTIKWFQDSISKC